MILILRRVLTDVKEVPNRLWQKKKLGLCSLGVCYVAYSGIYAPILSAKVLPHDNPPCFRIVPIVVPAPADSLHGLILVFARPQNLSAINSTNAEEGSDEPHNNQHYCQGTGNAIKSLAVQNLASLDSCERQASIREYEGPPVQ